MSVDLSKYEDIVINDKTDTTILYELLERDFYLGKEKIYAVDRLDNIYLAFDKKAKMWMPTNKETIFNDSPIKKDFYQIEKLLKGVYPWETFASIAKNTTKRREIYFEILINKTPHRVIGWMKTPRFADPIGPVHFNDSLAVLSRDIREHGYLFSGTEFQNRQIYPILDNYRYIDCLKQIFASVTAVARCEYQKNDFTNYVDLFYIPDSEIKLPRTGYYDGIKLSSTHFEVSEDTFYKIKGKVYAHNKKRVYYALPMEQKEGEFFPYNKMVLLSSKDNANQQYDVGGFFLLKDTDDFKRFKNYLKSTCDNYTEKVIYNSLEIMLKLKKKKPITLVLLTKVDLMKNSD